MPLVIRDGYTLAGSTKSEFGSVKGLPILNFRYRPALTEALQDWRLATKAAQTGAAIVEASAALIANHLVSWDAEETPGKPAPVTAELVRELPEPIFEQLLDAVITWAPKAEEARGNSAGV